MWSTANGACTVWICACRKIKPVKPSTWSAKEILGMKREALLDCFDTMKACYGRPWARTSVDLAIEVPSVVKDISPVCLVARKAGISILRCLAANTGEFCLWTAILLHTAMLTSAISMA